MSQSARKRIVITGMGAISPNGIGVDAFAAALAAGESGISALEGINTGGMGSGTPMPVRVSSDHGHASAPSHLKSWAAAAVKDFDVTSVLDVAEARRVPRLVPMAIAASREAMNM